MSLRFYSRGHVRRCLIILLTVLVFFSPAMGEEDAGSPDVLKSQEIPLSHETIQRRRALAESDPRLQESQKQKALELYDNAERWLKQADETQAQLTQLNARVEGAPHRIEEIHNGSARSVREMPDIGGILAQADQQSIELALAREQSALQQSKDDLRRYTDELAQLLPGVSGLDAKIASTRQLLEQIDAGLRAPDTSAPEAVQEARAMVLKGRQLLRRTELEIYRLQIASNDLLTNLAQAERDFVAAEVSSREQRVDTLVKVTAKLREVQARMAREEAEAISRQTGELPDALRAVADENTRHRKELEGLIQQEQSVSEHLDKVRGELSTIKDEFERTRQRVDLVEPSVAIGKMLKRRRAELPSLKSYWRSSAKRDAEIGHATDRQIEIDELLREHPAVEAEVAAALQGKLRAERVSLEQDGTQLLNARRDALNELQKVYGRYISQVTSLEVAQRQLAEAAEEYINYINDQLVWIPGPIIWSLADPGILARGLAWLLSPDQWRQVAADIRTLIQQKPLHVALLLISYVALLWNRKKSLLGLHEIAAKTRKISTDSFTLTLHALLYTLIVVGAWPLLLSGSGWLLITLPTASSFSVMLASGLIKMGAILFSVRLLIQICQVDGLGDSHLRWPEAARTSVSREFGWLLPFAVSAGFLVATTVGGESPLPAQAVGRIAFIIIMLIACVFVFRLLRPKGPFLQSGIRRNGQPGLARQLHFIWFPLALLLPLALVATAVSGYYDAAIHLEQRAERTFWFFVLLFLAKELLLRFLYISERRLRLEDALRRREEQRALRSQGEGVSEDEGAGVQLEFPELDIDALGEQNKRLIRTGFLLFMVLGVWGIWRDLLPALEFLNSTELPFHATRVVAGETKEIAVTLGDVTLGFFMLLITALAAKNIPGVLEIALLQRLPLDPGVRYAITTLSQYSIVGIGGMIAFSTLGLQWSSIQWLVAALSVGLGFGLQEIVANFISGIILLFERPIRIGDVVTLDDTTGVVSRIRIRATTITNWDKQELLIPNKEFITGRVINWTLTDKVNRVIVTVGVAYGSDIPRAMELMYEAAEENENVLEDPRPIVSFEGFGDNALTLLLRSYLGSMDNRLATITALHRTIYDKFNAANINIAFPQRDVHLSVDRPLDIQLHGADSPVKP